jgi:ubiquinol-cytochrome c reductase cytochrome c1 subunit
MKIKNTPHALARIGAVLAVFALMLTACSVSSHAEESSIKHLDWPQDGVMGTYDKATLQRGFQVYREVCSACHSMRLLSYRNLSDLGYNDAEIKAIAASVTVTDGPNDQGEMFDRPGLPSDRFKSPFANDKAARAANGGALPKDFSLIVKAREGGPDYIVALMTGYKDAPAGFPLGKGLYYNEAFPGHQIAMPPPLTDGRVDFAAGPDGKKPDNSIAAEAYDVAEFLSWASEPHLNQRHRMGFEVMIFLIVFAGVMYGAKRKVWRDVHH